MLAQAVIVKNDEYAADTYFGDRLGSEMEHGWYASIWYFDSHPCTHRDEFHHKDPYVGPFPSAALALAAVEGALVDFTDN